MDDEDEDGREWDDRARADLMRSIVATVGQHASPAKPHLQPVWFELLGPDESCLARYATTGKERRFGIVVTESDVLFYWKGHSDLTDAEPDLELSLSATEGLYTEIWTTLVRLFGGDLPRDTGVKQGDDLAKMHWVPHRSRPEPLCEIANALRGRDVILEQFGTFDRQGSPQLKFYSFQHRDLFTVRHDQGQLRIRQGEPDEVGDEAETDLVLELADPEDRAELAKWLGQFRPWTDEEE